MSFFPKPNVTLHYLLYLILPFTFSITITSLSAQGGYTLDFDGTDDHVVMSSSPGYTTNMTLEAWIKNHANPFVDEIIGMDGSGSGHLLEFRIYNKKLELLTNNGSFGTVTGTTDMDDNQWHHVAFVKQGTAGTLYVDGKIEATGTVLASLTLDHMVIGNLYQYGSPAGGDYEFDGKIDEVRIWSDARTQAEIQANMQRELEGSEANLVAYYQMSDGSGTTLTDNSSSGYNGTFSGAPTWKTSGALAGPDMAIDFDGSNDYVVADLNFTATSTLTIEGWVNFNTLTSQQNLYNIHQTSSSSIRIVPYKTSGNVISFFVYDGSSIYVYNSTYTVPSANEWHHYAFVYDAGTVTIYADGENVGSTSGQGSFSTAANNEFSVGADFNGVSGQFYTNAKFDEVRFWSDARTADEIRANKDRSLDGTEANLVAYYRFDQQAASGHTTAYDFTGNGHNGTLTNMDATTDWVSSNPFNTWIGSEDSDWNNADNWGSGTVPSSEDIGIFTWNGSNLPASSNISGRNFYVDAGVSLSHSGNLTLSGDFYNAGTFTTSGTLTFSGSSNQSLAGSGTTTIGTLTLDNSAGLTIESAGVTVNTSLTLTSGVLDLNGQTLSLGNSVSVSGSPAAGNHVKATSGILRKGYAGTGSFTFPVGDGTNYTPMTLNFTTGSFTSAYADVNLTTSKHPQNSSPNHYLNRYWTVSSSGISGFSCTVSATYADGDIAGTESELKVGKWNGSTWSMLGSATPASNLLAGTVNSFSDFTGGEGATFPVEWLSFEATYESGITKLTWETSQEVNSDYFSVERSTDLEKWEELGTVRAAGNSQNPLSYSFLDQLPSLGELYYRIRQVDFDGAFSYSELRSVNIQPEVMIYPNPVTDELFLNLPGNGWQGEVMDMAGRTAISFEGNVNTLNVKALAAGTYQIVLKNRLTGRQISYKILKK